MFEKTITCTFTHFLVSGIAYISSWDESEGTINMTPTEVENEADIYKAINDAGFGCRDILYALIKVQACYTNGAKKFVKEEFYNCINPNKEIPENAKDAIINADCWN